METTKRFSVFTAGLAHYLAKHRFKIVGKAVNKEDPRYYVYYFDDTPELRECVEKYKNYLKRKRNRKIYEAQKNNSAS